MNVDEVTDLLELISIHYKDFDVDDNIIFAWLDVLHPYDKEEVEAELKECMADKQFRYEPPKAYYLVRNLTKKYDKVDYSKMVIYCQRCNRPLNQGDYDKHFDRCSSVEYILNQCKRFNTQCRYYKKELYDMTDADFKNYYEGILKYVAEHTTDASEKKIIGFIFNPPRLEKAKEFLKN